MVRMELEPVNLTLTPPPPNHFQKSTLLSRLAWCIVRGVVCRKNECVNMGSRVLRVAPFTALYKFYSAEVKLTWADRRPEQNKDHGRVVGSES